MSDAIVCDGCGTTDREVQHSGALGMTLCGKCFDARWEEATKVRLRARLVDARRFLRRFVVMSSAGLDVLAVWVIHTWLFDAAETTPYVSIRSPERESGKTRVIEVTVMITRNPEQVADASNSALFRAIEKFNSTLLFDEVDGVFNGRDEDSKDIKRLLNAGYRKGATVLRTVGEKHEPKRFRTFSPKLLAGIGGLPDTLESRCIPISMQRRLPSEPYERLRLRKVRPEAEELAATLEELNCPALIESLSEADPDLPEELGDRAQDCAEPLLAICDYAGGTWPSRIRKALVELHGGRAIQNESVRTRLLFDIKTVFGEQKQLRTKELLEGLHALEESPWGDWFGKPLNANKLAGLLHDYGIHSRGIRIGEKTPKGYLRDDFEPAWQRYSPPATEDLETADDPESASQAATPQQAHEQAANGTSQAATPAQMLRHEKAQKPQEGANVAALRPETPDTREHDLFSVDEVLGDEDEGGRW